MTRVGAPGSGTCALSQTPLGDCQSLSPPGTRGACLPRHAAPDMLVTKADIPLTKADILRFFLQPTQNQRSYNVSIDPPSRCALRTLPSDDWVSRAGLWDTGLSSDWPTATYQLRGFTSSPGTSF